MSIAVEDVLFALCLVTRSLSGWTFFCDTSAPFVSRYVFWLPPRFIPSFLVGKTCFLVRFAW